MARKRTIDPDSWTDEKLADLDIGPHLLWVGLVSLADDDGRIEWSARQFKFRLFAAKTSVSISDVAQWMGEVENRAVVRTYSVDGKEYAFHPAWSKHQHVNKPAKSRIPPPIENQKTEEIAPKPADKQAENVSPSTNPPESPEIPREFAKSPETIRALGIRYSVFGIRYSESGSGSAEGADATSPPSAPMEPAETPPRSADASPPLRAKRIAVVDPRPVQVEFADDEPAVLAVLANDAATRRDGKISENVLRQHREKLGRHLAKQGLEAFRYGLFVAANGGKGTDYATGVMRRYVPGEDQTRTLRLVASSPPAKPAVSPATQRALDMIAAVRRGEQTA